MKTSKAATADSRKCAEQSEDRLWPCVGRWAADDPGLVHTLCASTNLWTTGISESKGLGFDSCFSYCCVTLGKLLSEPQLPHLKMVITIHICRIILTGSKWTIAGSWHRVGVQKTSVITVTTTPLWVSCSLFLKWGNNTCLVCSGLPSKQDYLWWLSCVNSIA